MSSEDILLSVRGLMKRFEGLTAVRWVDLDVGQHSIASLIGPNGAGKTTFFNCITGLYPPDDGEILFKGESIWGLSADRIARAGIARTYQNTRLFEGMTVLEQVLVGMHPRLRTGVIGAILRTSAARHEERVALEQARALLDFIGLGNQGALIASSLPYGLQRRLEIVRALASAPDLLLLDEPTAGMNPNETEDMMRFIQRLRDERGLAILLIEHDMRLVMTISDRVTVLDYGQKIAEGTPAEVQRDPRVIAAYLGVPPESDL